MYCLAKQSDYECRLTQLRIGEVAGEILSIIDWTEAKVSFAYNGIILINRMP